MKKTSYLLVLAAVVLIFSGCGKKSETNPVEGLSQANKEESTGSKVVNSIKDAMGLGQKMECVYTTNVDGKEMVATTWVDGNNFKSSSSVDGKIMYSLMKDEVMYTWGEGVPVASKLSLSCMKDLEKNIPQTEGTEPKTDNIKNPEEYFDDATDVSCKPVASVDLSLPGDIQFQDMCEMMKGFSNGLSEQMKNIKIPADGEVPELPADLPTVPTDVNL